MFARSALITTALFSVLSSACVQYAAPDLGQGDIAREDGALSLATDPLTLDFPTLLTAAGAEPGEMVVFSVDGVELAKAAADDRGVAKVTVVLDGAGGHREVAVQAASERRSSEVVRGSTVDCLHVPADQPTVQKGIDAAADGGVVCVAAGTYAERVELVGRDVVVVGEDAATTVLDGGGYRPVDGPSVLDVSETPATTAVSRLTITGGHHPLGAGVKAVSSSAQLRDLVVRGNVCDVPYAQSPNCVGTGVYVYGGAPVLRDVVLSDNTCALTTEHGWSCSGGGAAIERGRAQLERVDVVGNVQDAGQQRGAGLYLLDTDATLSSVRVEGNAQVGPDQQLLHGAGVWVGGDSDVLLDDVSVLGNTQDCEGKHGSCASYGAGVYVEKADLSLAHSTIEGNRSDAKRAAAAGLFMDGGSVVVDDVRVLDNHLSSEHPSDGGAIRVGRWGHLQGQTLLVADNRATVDPTTTDDQLHGVGLYVDERGEADLVGVAIVDNVGTSETHGWARGTGAYVDYEGTLRLTNAVIAGNHGQGRAAQGAGLYVDLFAELVELDQVDIVGNTTSIEGQTESVYLGSHITMTVRNSSIGGQGRLFAFSGTNTVAEATYSNLWGDILAWDPAGADGNLAVDPSYRDLSAGAALDWDLRLSADSWLVDQGDPAVSDDDGSRSDIGAYGGPGASLLPAPFGPELEVQPEPEPEPEPELDRGLRITEYAEGARGHEKYLEISAGRDGVALGACAVELHHNGAVEPTAVVPLGGSLDAGASLVLCHDRAQQGLCDVASPRLSFNGDDAVVLTCGGAVVDQVGQVGVDPGTAWSADGLSTADQVLRRRCDATATGPFDLSQWELAGADDLSGLGTDGCSAR